MRVAFSRIDRNTNSRSPGDFEIRRNISEFAVSRSSASSRSRRNRADSLSARTADALRRFGVAAFRPRDLTDAEPALERRRIAHPKGLGLRRFSKSITAGICDRRNGVHGSVCTAATPSREYHLRIGRCVRRDPPPSPGRRPVSQEHLKTPNCVGRHILLGRGVIRFHSRSLC